MSSPTSFGSFTLSDNSLLTLEIEIGSILNKCLEPYELDEKQIKMNYLDKDIEKGFFVCYTKKWLSF